MIDVLIGAVVGLIILGAAIKIYVDNINASSGSLQSAKLNQEVNAILHLITQDVRRAGYWGADPRFDDLAANPFTQGFNNIVVANMTGEDPNSCLTYSYDLNEDKLIGVGTLGGPLNAPFTDAKYTSGALEQFGFRLNNGNLELRQGLAAGDTVIGCNNGVWTRVNSDIIQVSQFTLALENTCYSLKNLYVNPGDPTPYCTPAVKDVGQEIRALKITLTAQLNNNTGTSKNASAYVKIRNDRYVANVP